MKRFFSESSFWNQPIGENPDFDPRSEYFVSLLKEEPRWRSIDPNNMK
jgi:hypothetical protein